MGTKLPESAVGRRDRFDFDPFKLHVVGFDRLPSGKRLGPEHPLWDERVGMLGKLDEGMVLNIMEHGVLQDIKATREVIEDAELTLVWLGRRRVVHAREATERLRRSGSDTLVTVPGRLERMLEERSLEQIVSENEIRRDDTTFVKAEKAARQLGRGTPVDRVAVSFGVARSTVAAWTQAMSATREVVDAWRGERIDATQALALSKLSREEQATELPRVIEAGTSGRDLLTKQRARASSTTTDDEREAVKRPSIAIVRKILRALEENDCGVDPKTHQALRWVAGEINERSVGGLRRAMRRAGLVEQETGDE